MFTVARICYKFTGDELRTINIEKIIVVPDELSEEASDLRNYEDQPPKTQVVTPPQLPAHKCTAIDPDLAKLAFSFGQYLNSLTGQSIPQLWGSHCESSVTIRLDKDMFATLVSEN